jgi:hypothetical protein
MTIASLVLPNGILEKNNDATKSPYTKITLRELLKMRFEKIFERLAPSRKKERVPKMHSSRKR